MEELDALLEREARYYRTTDYFLHQDSLVFQHKKVAPRSLESLPAPLLISMLQECASIVTDLSSVQSPVIARWSSDGDQKSTTTPESPSSVSAVPTNNEGQKSTTAGAAASNPSKQDFSFWRNQMCHWAFVVVKNFSMDKETVSVAFNLLDRYVVHELSVPGAPTITREDYQLFAMTALYIAVKVLEPYPRKIALDALVVMSRDFYSQEDILHTEWDMFTALSWRINNPTVLTFCRLYLKESSEEDENCLSRVEAREAERICALLTERVVADSFFVPFQDSMIGLACVLYATQVMGLSQDKLRPLMERVHRASSSSCPEHATAFDAVMEKLYLMACF